MRDHQILTTSPTPKDIIQQAISDSVRMHGLTPTHAGLNDLLRDAFNRTGAVVDPVSLADTIATVLLTGLEH